MSLLDLFCSCNSRIRFKTLGSVGVGVGFLEVDFPVTAFLGTVLLAADWLAAVFFRGVAGLAALPAAGLLRVALARLGLDFMVVEAVEDGDWAAALLPEEDRCLLPPLVLLGARPAFFLLVARLVVFVVLPAGVFIFLPLGLNAWLAEPLALFERVFFLTEFFGTVLFLLVFAWPLTIFFLFSAFGVLDARATALTSWSFRIPLQPGTPSRLAICAKSAFDWVLRSAVVITEGTPKVDCRTPSREVCYKYIPDSRGDSRSRMLERFCQQPLPASGR